MIQGRSSSTGCVRTTCQQLAASIRQGGLLLLALWLLTVYPAPLRADVSVSQISPKLSVFASLRARGEFWDWFEGTSGDSSYAYAATVAKLGLKWRQDLFDLHLEAQNTALMGLPDDASTPAPQGSFGLGPVYLSHNRRRNDASVFLKQAYLTLKQLGIPGLRLRGGRLSVAEGAEVMSKDPTIDWIKRMRVSQRLLGPFGWSHVGRSYDGFTLSWTRGAYNFTLHGSHPTQAGFDLAGNKTIDDIDILYASFNLTRPEFAKTTDARLFYIYYADGRNLQPTDNRPAIGRTGAVTAGASWRPPPDHRHLAINTGGGNLIHIVPTGAGPIDLMGWGVVQGGDWGRQDHHGWAFAVEAGWQPKGLPWKPWFRIGYNRSSGDDDPSDSDHDTFFQMLPTARVYSFSTFYNLMNNEDIFFQLILRPLEGLVWRTDFHYIRVSEKNDLWYQGAGATLQDRQAGFGFVGRPVFGKRDLFQIIETSLSYNLNKHINVNAFFAHVFGDSIVDQIYPDDSANFGYIETTLKF